MRRLPTPPPQPVVGHAFTFVKLGQQLTKRVLLSLSIPGLLRLARSLFVLAGFPSQPPIRNAQRPVRDSATLERERLNGQNLTIGQKIPQPLVRKTLQQRVERQGNRRNFDCHTINHREKIARLALAE